MSEHQCPGVPQTYGAAIGTQHSSTRHAIQQRWCSPIKISKATQSTTWSRTAPTHDTGLAPPCHLLPSNASLREGAIAVLGTQIPVDARKDQLPLGRFFTNLRAGITGEL